MPHTHAHLVAVDMGYGHERAAYALRELSGGAITIANNYEGIPDGDRETWDQGRRYYETISRARTLPVIGKSIFHMFLDHFQEIDPFYPRRDLSEVGIQTRQIYHSIARGLGQHLIEMLRTTNGRKPLPLVTTFFAPAFAAEVHDYPGEIYVVVCDADIARAWAPRDPKRSRIKYFAPNGRVVERLQLYGVRRDHIFLTGFPLPKELIGGPRGEIVKHDLGLRIATLDPQQSFRGQHRSLLRSHFGAHVHEESDRPVTITFAVGGAGAQRRIAVDLLRGLRGRIRRGEIRLQLVAGTRREVARFFSREVHAARLGDALRHGNIAILSTKHRADYFPAFSRAMRTTDILWTKPSELSFYAGLGIPIIMADPIGSQEVFNREWLRQVGAGLDQLDVRYASEWLWDWIQSGAFARMAWNGYNEAPTHGAYRIEAIVRGKQVALDAPPMTV